MTHNLRSNRSIASSDVNPRRPLQAIFLPAFFRHHAGRMQPAGHGVCGGLPDASPQVDRALPAGQHHRRAGAHRRAVAVTSAAREPSFPDLPTVADTVPGYEATAWFGVGMPKGTPREAIDKMNAAVNKALADPKMRVRLADLGGAPIPGTPEDFGKVIVAETEKWAKVVASSGATVD